MLGTGLIQGLVVTAKNLVGSFHDPARYTTLEYPEVKPQLPEAYRNFPFLVTENAEDPMGTMRCVACQICEKECPPQCIYIEKSKDKKPDATGKPQIYPAVFDIDMSVCMSCQICVEVCPFDAIKMDQVFEIATDNRFGALLLNREQLAKPNAYYHTIHPVEAAEVDARLAADRQAAAEKARAAALTKAAAPARPVPAAAPKPAATVAGVADPGPASPRPATTKPASPTATPSDEPRRSPTGEGGRPTPSSAIAPVANAPKPPEASA